ncbi:MAG: hypothetical protein J3K34DRAFT_463022 [Monoraphidium minutum]|nr:MAG: hypothetical protein J3K34DRAFT_463022 [Monoraphidium minutum]
MWGVMDDSERRAAAVKVLASPSLSPGQEGSPLLSEREGDISSASSSLASAQSAQTALSELDDAFCETPDPAARPAPRPARSPSPARGAAPPAACGAGGDDLPHELLALFADEEEAEHERAAPPPAGAPPAAGLAGEERANLVNWMTSAAGRLGLPCDALFSGVACLDALKLHKGDPRALLSAAACLWVASKWALGAAAPPAGALAATLPPCNCGGCGACGGGRGAAGVLRRRLVRAEVEVLTALDFGARVLRRPTAHSFLQHALLRLPAPPAGAGGAAAHRTLLTLCSLLAEQSLLESQLLALRPSAVAAGCVAYAHALLGRPLPAAALAAATGAAAAGASRAADMLRAVHAAVAAAAAGGNPYACSLRWMRVDAPALRVAPIVAAGDTRLAALSAAAAAAAAAAAHGGAAAAVGGGEWRWVLPA